MNLLTAPFINALFGFYYLVGNLGWSVVIVTALIKLITLPLVLPSIKTSKIMQTLNPRLKQLQEKYKNDKQKLATAQMELYKEYGVNPLAGCLPQLLQIAVLLLFFSAFNSVIAFGHGQIAREQVNSFLIQPFRVEQNFAFSLDFLGSNLGITPAKAFGTGIIGAMLLPFLLLVGSGAAQFLSAKMMMPSSTKATDGKPIKVNDTAYTKETPGKEDDMMAAMRTQSLYFMPLMTIFIGWNFSLGVLLYWFVNSVTMIFQQLAVARLTKAEQPRKS